jgi:ProP effector
LLKTKAPGGGDAGDLGKASSQIEDLSPTKNASTSKAAARHDQTVAAVLQLLAEKWPACFQIFEPRRRPIKVGIHLDILAALGGDVTSAEVKSALRLYTGNLGYLLACREGVERVDLNGAPARLLQPKRPMPPRSLHGGRTRQRRSRSQRSRSPPHPRGSGWPI